MRFAFRPLLGALVLSFLLVGCDAAGPDAMSASLAAPHTAEAAKSGSGWGSVTGPDSMKPGATCTFYYNGENPPNGWGSFPEFQLMSSGLYAASFKAVGQHGDWGRVWAYNQNDLPIKKTVTIDTNAPNCSSVGVE